MRILIRACFTTVSYMIEFYSHTENENLKTQSNMTDIKMMSYLFKFIASLKNNKNWPLFLKGGLALFLFLLSFGIHFIFLTNPVRMKQISRKKTKPLKEIVVQLLKNDLKVRAITKKENGFVKLEIFKIQVDGKARLMNSLIIGRYEAFFEHRGDTITLGALDYNGDGSLEIIATGLDEFFRPKVHILEYNKQTDQFEQLN